MNNLIAMIGMWSISAFSYYLVGLYIKYFPGNIYVNYSMLGIADMAASFHLRIIQKYLNTKNSFRLILAGILVSSVFLSMILQFVTD